MTRRTLSSCLALLVWLSAFDRMAGAEPHLRRAVLSVCQAGSPLRRYAAHRVTIRANVITTEDAYRVYLIDARCPDSMVAVQFPDIYPPQSGIQDWVDLLYRHDATVLGKRLYCICTGRIRDAAGIGVMKIEKVESAWASAE